ncbi:uncharacterized protein A4U43_C05F14210 [Asparagus officinalis]|uniref:Uncharacterized protein n=1 Tax=Asparagus officinalis TaxID=4686 RepID=A0A5P1EU39_ASPOF|nr:uncharacterized protein A4U43_C05F14210 [Asparagus officinalis]
MPALSPPQISFLLSLFPNPNNSIRTHKIPPFSPKSKKGAAFSSRTVHCSAANKPSPSSEELSKVVAKLVEEGKIKFASVKLAKRHMKRVATELQVMGASNKDPALEYMLLQGVRFAFRIHQFAGGLDSETMHAFGELRNLAHVRKKL